MADEERPSLDTLIKSWLITVGEEKFTKSGIPYYFIEFKSYPESLNSLLQTIISHGYGQDDVESVSLLRKIQEVMTPEVHDTHKLNDWKNIIGRIWKHFAAKEYADASLVKPAKNYAKTTPKPKLSIAASEGEVMPPINKLDPDKFEGFGESSSLIDEDFVKMLEALKNE